MGVHRWVVAWAIVAGCSEYDVAGGKSPGYGTGASSTGTNSTDTTTGTGTGTGTETDPYGTGTGSGGTGTGSGGGTGTGTGTGGGTGTGTGGNDPDPHRGENAWTDEIIQPTTSYADVLWVVDNSCSMEDDQGALAREFPTFIDFFDDAEGIDYHIGVVSTDMEDRGHRGRLREGQGVRWIDNDTVDPQRVFADMALMGTGGSGDEAGRAPAFLALTEHLSGWNAGFIREEASLSVIVISDEDDMSTQFGVGITEFVNFMRGFKSDPALVSFSTIVGDVPGGCPTADPGLEYPEVRVPLGGQFHSICSPDWDTVLTSLAANAIGMRNEFFLTEIPEEDSLEVEVVEADGTVVWLRRIGVEFTYDPARNSVTLLTYTPGPLASVFVHYEVDFGALP